MDAEIPDIREKGAPKDGEEQASTRRLYLQLHVFDRCERPDVLMEALGKCGLQSVLYLDLHRPRGVATLLIADDPDAFIGKGRRLLGSPPFIELEPRPELTMSGRTYSTGREPNLEFWLLEKPRRTALNSAWPWAIWYPLRRKSEFELLSPEDRGRILHEHATIGFSYGKGDYAHDIRLACHGLDQQDNDFVIGLVGKELFPLSRLVQEMRKTEQTAKHIQSLGPFFVGKAVWRSPLS